MGHSREEKAKNHQRIVEIAARRIRESGTDGPGVAEIMREAGLTHGGFYKHFDSRDDLVAVAVDAAARQSVEASREVTAEAEDPLAALVDWYLSTAHRDNAGAGCAVVALGADAARGDDRVRAAYRGQVERYLADLEALLGDDDGDAADTRRRAIAVLTSMVGALLISRAVDDEDLSEEILREVRATLRHC